MDLSIIIINYNTFQDTSNCISSVYAQTKGINFEIILIDNGSFECDAEQFKLKFPDIILVKNAKNLGFAVGVNLGINYAKGELILLLNSDVMIVENTIKESIDKLTSLPPDVVTITCKIKYPNGNVQPQCNRFPSIQKEVLELTRIHKLMSYTSRAKLFLSTYFDHESDIYPDWIWGTFFMFKREVLSLMPGNKLNDEYFLYGEDLRWCYDVHKVGKKIYYFSQPFIYHQMSKSSKYNDQKYKYVILNEMDFIKKTRGILYLWIYTLIRVLNLISANSITNLNKLFAVYYLKNLFPLPLKNN